MVTKLTVAKFIALTLLGLSVFMPCAYAEAKTEVSRLRFLCNDGGKPYFAKTPNNKNCQSQFLEETWDNFAITRHFIADYMPTKIVRENDGIKVWTQFFFAEPVSSDDAKWHYDYVKGVTKYYCGIRQMMLIQATYFYKSERIYERLSNEAVMEEIEPDTLSETLYTKLCT